MHRTFCVPRLVGCWSIALALALPIGLNSAAAQPKEQIDIPVIVMAVGTTQTYQASSKEKLKLATNPNPKVVNLSKLAGDPTAVVIEALAPGRVRLTLTDVKDAVEVVDVLVLSDRVKDLRDLIQRSVPNAAVTVTANESNSLVVLNGNVLSEPDARVIRTAAINLFGPNVVDNIRIGGVQQVQLHVVVAVVNRSLARNMSFSWVANGNEWFFGSLFGGPFNFTNNVATGVFNAIAPTTGSNITNSGTFNLPFGVIHNNNNFLSFLQLLSTEGVTKIMAEPRVTTLSGRPANIVSGGQTPILTSGGVGVPSVSFKNFGTVVSCLPTVLSNGKILLEVAPQISAINQANGINITGVTPTSIPGFDVRSAQVTIMVEDGQTLAIGGLIQNKITGSLTKIPVLGDLPYLSVFFQQKSYTEQEEEMIILVTPRLVDPVDCTKIPPYLPGRETRSPDDCEFFLEGILEAPRGPRNVIFHPHLYQAAFKNAPNIGQVPCADGSCYGAGRGGCASGNCGVIAAPTHATTPTVMPGAPAATAPSTPKAVPATPPAKTVSPAPVARPQKTVSAPTIPTLPAIPSLPPVPTSSRSNRITIETETFTPQSVPSFAPAAPNQPSVPILPTPPRELQNRPVLPPLSPTPNSPN